MGGDNVMGGQKRKIKISGNMGVIYLGTIII